MFIVVLFAMAEIMKQPKCPMTHEWKKEMKYMNTK